MEYILVNSVKLKIMLSPQDRKDYGLSSDTGDISFSQPALRKLLDKAFAETGFDTKHANLYVQAFPAPDGSVELFLTRRSRLLPEPEEEKSAFRKKYRLSGEESKKQYIVFSDGIDALADLCVRMHREGFPGESTLYLLQNRYYLYIDFPKRLPSFVQGEVRKSAAEQAERFGYLGDYAAARFADRLTLARLSEHAKVLIAEKAVETLARAFSGT